MRTEKLSDVINIIRTNFPKWEIVNAWKEQTLSQLFENRIWFTGDKDIPMYGTYIIAWCNSESVCKEWGEAIYDNYLEKEIYPYTYWVATESVMTNQDCCPCALIIQIGVFLEEDVTE